MKNSQKGFIVPLSIAVIALLVIGGSVYIYKNKKVEAPVIVDTETQQSNQNQQQTNTQTLPVTTQQNSSVTTALTESDILTATYSISAKISSKAGDIRTVPKLIIFPKHTTDNTDISTDPVYIDKSGNLVISMPIGGEAFWIYKYEFTNSTHNQAKVYIGGNYGASAYDNRIFLVKKTNEKITTKEIMTTKTDEASDWKTYIDNKFGYSIAYPAGTQIDANATTVYFRPTSTKGELSIDVVTSSANCFNTASGAEPTYATINNINYTVWGRSKEYSIGSETWATAKEYCVVHNGSVYKITSKLPYKAGTTPSNVDKDVVLNQMIASFKLN